MYEYILAEATSNQTLDLPFPVTVDAQAALGSTVDLTAQVSVPDAGSGQAGEASSQPFILTIDQARIYLPILRR